MSLHDSPFSRQDSWFGVSAMKRMSGSDRSREVTAEEWEAYWHSRNACGLVGAHKDHIVQVATLLSERYPGFFFLWDCPGTSKTAMICVVRPDKRKIASRLEARIVAAAERIADRVARQQRIARGRLDWLFKRHLKPGWRYADKTEVEAQER
jgi:hypothetical protein